MRFNSGATTGSYSKQNRGIKNIGDPMVLVEFKNVVKKFKSKVVLDELTFQIPQFSSVGLIGNNGAGKSTTINILCNILKYDSGSVFYKNSEISKRSYQYKSDMGIILSNPCFIEEFTPEEYLSVACYFHNIPKTERKSRITNLLTFFEIDAPKKKRIKALSAGNRAKVSLAASLIHNPHLLVFDEPFVNLDFQSAEKIMDLLHQIKKNKTLLITSHHIDLVFDVCESFLIMNKGKIRYEVGKQEFPDANALKRELKSLVGGAVSRQDLSWLY